MEIRILWEDKKETEAEVVLKRRSLFSPIEGSVEVLGMSPFRIKVIPPKWEKDAGEYLEEAIADLKDCYRQILVHPTWKKCADVAIPLISESNPEIPRYLDIQTARDAFLEFAGDLQATVYLLLGPRDCDKNRLMLKHLDADMQDWLLGDVQKVDTGDKFGNYHDLLLKEETEKDNVDKTKHDFEDKTEDIGMTCQDEQKKSHLEEREITSQKQDNDGNMDYDLKHLLQEIAGDLQTMVDLLSGDVQKDNAEDTSEEERVKIQTDNIETRDVDVEETDAKDGTNVADSMNDEVEELEDHTGEKLLRDMDLEKQQISTEEQCETVELDNGSEDQQNQTEICKMDQSVQQTGEEDHTEISGKTQNNLLTDDTEESDVVRYGSEDKADNIESFHEEDNGQKHDTREEVLRDQDLEKQQISTEEQNETSNSEDETEDQLQKLFIGYMEDWFGQQGTEDFGEDNNRDLLLKNEAEKDNADETRRDFEDKTEDIGMTCQDEQKQDNDGDMEDDLEYLLQGIVDGYVKNWP